MFTLEQVVPWGRSLDEYRRMFDLSADDLRLRSSDVVITRWTTRARGIRGARWPDVAESSRRSRAFPAGDTTSLHRVDLPAIPHDDWKLSADREARMAEDRCFPRRIFRLKDSRVSVPYRAISVQHIWGNRPSGVSQGAGSYAASFLGTWALGFPSSSAPSGPSPSRRRCTSPHPHARPSATDARARC